MGEEGLNRKILSLPILWLGVLKPQDKLLFKVQIKKT
jgi:hypothetical protein